MFRRLRLLCLCGSGDPAITATANNIRLIESAAPIEEERLPHYDPVDFYPVRLGEVLNDRYEVLGKIGYGSKATVWLCQDTQ